MTMFYDDNIQTDLSYIRKKIGDKNIRFDSKTVLITGGAGFLGYYLSYYFMHLRAENIAAVSVVLTDNFMRGKPNWISELELNFGSAFRTIVHDVVKPLPPEVIDCNPDYIIHAASIASPIFYRKSPIETMDANVLGLRSLLDYAVERKRTTRPVQGFLFFSSSEIYGSPDPEFIPTPEYYNGNVSCTGPRACYDESKRFGETLCVNFAHQHQIPITIARPFNNYGPGLKLKDGRVVSDFASNILNGEDIVLLSDGSASRTFCYIADAVHGYLLVLLCGSPGEPYNIGIEKPEISIKKFAELFSSIGQQVTGCRSIIVTAKSEDPNYTVDNPERRCPDISKARSIGYDPTVTLEDGLHRTLLWYQKFKMTW